MQPTVFRLLFVGKILFVPLLAVPSSLHSQDKVPSVNDFLYQLQNINLTAIGESAYELIIIDYSADGSDELAFTLEEIQKNAGELVSDFPEYLVTINGVGEEDIFYGYPDDGEQTPDEMLDEILPHLDLLVENDKWVLLTAYTTNTTQLEAHHTEAIARGYIPFATVRDLDVLTINSGYEPD
jgi:endo-alpha-1,4-polygalactosaminidase (GH114 family)